MSKKKIWGPSTRKKFLKTLEKTGRVIESCEAAGISYDQIRHYMKSDSKFELECKLANQTYNEWLERRLEKRGVTGIEKPVFYAGNRVDAGKVIEVSDRCLIELLKSRMPEKYSEQRGKVDVNAGQGGVIVVNSTPETIDKWKKRFQKEKDETDGKNSPPD